MRTGLIVCLILFISFYSLNFLKAEEIGFPTRPIEIQVGFSPGGATDIGARFIAEHSKKYLGQEVVVVNKPGGGGRVALALVSKAKPDGYTLGAVTDGNIDFSPHLEKVPYKPLDDFTFIIQFGVIHSGIVVLTESPFRTFKDLIEFARGNPDKLTIGTPGVGHANHLVFEALSRIENLRIKHVPFSGAAPTMTALLGGHVMVASTGAQGYSQLLKAKKVRLLAMMGEERIDAYPEAPTLKELGYPSLAFQGLYIIVGPKNMEKLVVNKLIETFKKAMDSPEFNKLSKDMEMWTKNPLPGNELKEEIIKRHAKNGEFLKNLGMGIK